MKKLLSLILALAMLGAMAVPALAADAGAADTNAVPVCPEEEEPAGPMEDWDFISWTAADAWQALCEEQPELTAQFLAQADGWFAGAYPAYSSLDQYVQEVGSREAAYLSLYPQWAGQQLVDGQLAALGGVPGQINVMVNGAFVQFTDAVPEIADGRTMVPFRAVMEALGGEADYADGVVTCTLGETVLTLTIGSDSMSVTRGGAAAAVTMDCAPYIKDGRTYVPVRFIGEALDYDVGWDGTFRTAIITDLDALAASIDKDFTVVNGLLAQQGALDGAQRAVGSAAAELTMFDSLNGDRTGNMTYSYDLTASLAGVSGRVDYDMSALWDLFGGYVPVPAVEGEPYEEYMAQLELLKGLLKGAVQMRVDVENGVCYVAWPALNAILRSDGTDVADGAWLSVPLTGGDGTGTAVISAASADIPVTVDTPVTVGALCCAQGMDSVYGFAGVKKAGDLLAKLMGDGKFTRGDGVRTLTITQDDWAALAEEIGADEETGAGAGQFSLTLALYDNGDADVELAGTAAIGGGSVAQVSAKGTQRGGKSELTAQCHVKNVLKLTVQMEETLTASDAAPEVTPPQGADIVPLEN